LEIENEETKNVIKLEYLGSILNSEKTIYCEIKRRRKSNWPAKIQLEQKLL
jgi:hypothetical protein